MANSTDIEEIILANKQYNNRLECFEYAQICTEINEAENIEKAKEIILNYLKSLKPFNLILLKNSKREKRIVNTAFPKII